MSPDPRSDPRISTLRTCINKAFSAFAAARSHSGLAPSTVRTYRHEVRYFVRWLEERTATRITRYPSSHSLASSHPALGLFRAAPLLLLEIMVDFVALRGLPSAHFGKELHRAELVWEVRSCRSSRRRTAPAGRRSLLQWRFSESPPGY